MRINQFDLPAPGALTTGGPAPAAACAATRIRMSVTTGVERPNRRPQSLRFTVTVRNGTTLLAVCGEVDASNSHQMVERTWDRPAGRALILDLSGLTFLSAAGVRALEVVGERCHDAAIRWVVIPSPAVRRLLDLCDPPERFPIAWSVSAAFNTVEP